MKNMLVIALALACGYLYMIGDIAIASSKNRIANAYCEGKGYDQGFVEDGDVWCQKITVKQDRVDYRI